MIKATKSDVAGFVVILLVAIGMGVGLAEMQLAGQAKAKRVDLYLAADGTWVSRAAIERQAQDQVDRCVAQAEMDAASATEFAWAKGPGPLDLVAQDFVIVAGGSLSIYGDSLSVEGAFAPWADGMALDVEHSSPPIFRPGSVVFFGHPFDRVEVDPETGRLTIYVQVAPVGSR